MTDAASIMTDLNLALDLFAKITGNLAVAKDVLSASDLEAARAKYAEVKALADQADAAFDAALVGKG